MDQKNKLFIGHHLNTRYGLLTTVDYAEKIGANFFQIFLTSPQVYVSKRHTKENLLLLGKKIKDKNMKIVVHASYLLNFCNPVDSRIHKSAIQSLSSDLNDSIHLNAIGVVVHMGKNVKELEILDSDAINNYVQGIKTVLKNTNNESIIILETGAGVGSEVCTSIIDLGKLYNKFTDDEKKRIKFCIDTCHIFSSGYNIGDEKYVEVFVDHIDIHLGWNNVACIHFNDSKCKLMSKKDRHADIGKGNIKIDGLIKFAKICYEKNIPIVLETPCEDNFSRDQQIKLVKSKIIN